MKQSEQEQNTKKWYVVHTQSGCEAKAKASIELRIRQNGFEDRFGEILVPSENVMELVKGQKQTRTRKFFPGYIFVEMDLNEETWHLVRGSNKVTGFVGKSGGVSKPTSISDQEVQRVTKQIEVGAEKPRPKISFQEGDSVVVIDGPFNNFNGTVEDVNPEKGKAKVLVSIFGRPTPVELDFIQIEKA